MKRLFPIILVAALVFVFLPSRALAQASNLQAALQSLKRAEQQLSEASTPDASGYRQRTLQLVQEAEQSLQQAIGYDARNNNQPTASKSTLTPGKGQAPKTKAPLNGVSKTSQ